MTNLTAKLFDENRNLVDTIHGSPNSIATVVASFAEGMAFEGYSFAVEFLTEQEG